MSSGVVGALRVDLGMETAAFKKGADAAKGEADKLLEHFKGIAAEIAGAFALEKLVEGFLKINESIDQLGKAAQKIGIPVEELSKLQYAAKLADVPFDELQTSIEKFDKGLSQAAATSKGPVAAAFKNMGISIRDSGGNVKDVNVLLGEAAVKFAAHADGANKTALAMGLFGKAGAAMIPLLNEGNKGIKEAGDQLAQFGGVVTKEAAESAKTLADDIKRLGTAFYSVAQQVVIDITPAITKFTSAIVDFLSNGGGAAKVADVISAALEKMAEIGVQIYGVLQKMGVFALYVSDRFANGFDPAKWQDYKNSIASVNAEVATGIGLIQKFALGAKDVTDRDHLGGGTSPTAPKKKTHFAAFGLLGDGISKHTKALDELAKAAKRIWDETRTPLEKYNEKLGELKKLLDAGKISQDTYGRAVEDAKTNYVHAEGALNKYTQTAIDGIDRMKEAADLAKNTMSSWFDSAINGTFNLGNALADLAKNIAKMGFENLLTGLFAGGGGNSLYGGGGGGFGSLGKLFGFASGGTILPGGSGGIDSQVVAFRKSPDERVDITKPGQMLSSGGGSAVHFNIDARGADAGRIAQLEQTLTRVINTLPATVKGIVYAEKRNNPGFAKA
ncbi:MAG: hypothetical protein ABJA10_07555 [Aestuariivirga sp.]